LYGLFSDITPHFAGFDSNSCAIPAEGQFKKQLQQLLLVLFFKFFTVMYRVLFYLPFSLKKKVNAADTHVSRHGAEERRPSSAIDPEKSDMGLLLLAIVASNPEATVSAAAVRRFFGGRRTLRAAQFHIWTLRFVAAVYYADRAAAAAAGTDDAPAVAGGADKHERGEAKANGGDEGTTGRADAAGSASHAGMLGGDAATAADAKKHFAPADGGDAASTTFAAKKRRKRGAGHDADAVADGSAAANTDDDKPLAKKARRTGRKSAVPKIAWASKKIKTFKADR
jgi:hypothetical protein